MARSSLQTVISSQRVLEVSLLAVLAAGATAQGYRLSDPPFAGTNRGDVQQAWSSPDGRWLVYATAGGTLYSLRQGHPGAIPLTDTRFGVDFSSLVIGPDNRRVVFLRPTAGPWELYSVPLDGSTEPTRLDGSVRLDSDATVSFSITADGRTVVFRPPTGAFSITFRYGLYSVPIDGGTAPVRLDAPSQGPGVRSYQILAGSDRVLFSSDGQLYNSALAGGDRFLLGAGEFFRLTSDETRAVFSPSTGSGLFSVPVAGGSPIQLTGLVVDPRFAIAPAGDRVVFLENSELFSALLDGSANPVRLNAPLPGGGAVELGFRITPSGRVIYLADQETNNVFELFSVPVNGSASPVRLNPPLGADRDVGLGYEQDARLISQLSPDGSRVVYISDQRTNDVFELFSVAADGSAPAVALQKPPVAAGDALLGFRFTADGTHIVYIADEDTDGRFELFSAPADGSALPTKLSGQLDANRDVQSFTLCSDSRSVAYVADAFSDEGFELFGAPIDGSSAPVRLNVPFPLVSTADVSSFRILPDGTRAIYRMDLDTDGIEQLFSVPTDGSTRPTRLSGPLWLRFGGLDPYLVSADGRSVVFLADQDGDGAFELCSTDSDGNGPSIVLSTPFAASSAVQFKLGARGDYAVYLEQKTGRSPELYSVALDGHAAPVLIAGVVYDFRISPDGSTLLYRGPSDDLFSASIAGDAPARNLTHFTSSALSDFQFTRDGARVVFGASEREGSPIQTLLYSVPVDGSSPPLQLTALVSGASVLSFSIGNRIVYRADQDSDDVYELYSVAADGSLPARKLSGAMTPGGDVHDARISPDGSRVFYSADQIVNEREELFSVPVDGSTTAFRIPDSAFAWLSNCAVDATGTRFVYPGAHGLSSIPVGGSSAAVLLGPATSGFTISADGSQVVFDSLVHPAPGREYRALFSIPIDASADARQITGPRSARGGFQSWPIGGPTSWQIDPHSERVLYVADESGAGVFELFAVPFAHPTHVERSR